MEIKLKSFMSLGLIFAAGGCGGSKSQNNDIPFTGTRSGKEVIAVEKEYTDSDASLSNAGDRVVFLSGRNGGIYKTYKFTVGTSTAAQRATAQNLGEEIEATISPDGLWIALKVLAADGSMKLYVQSFNDASQVVEVPKAGAFFSDMTFSQTAPLHLAFFSSDSSGVRSLKTALISTADNTPSAAEPKETRDLTASEKSLVWAKVSTVAGLMTWRSADQNFVFRAIGTTGGFAAAQGIKGSFGRVASVPFTHGASGLLYTEINYARDTKAIPVSDRAAADVLPVFPMHRAVVVGDTGTISRKIESKQYVINKISIVQDADLIGILGREVYDCKAAGTGVSFYGASVLLVNAGQQVSLLMVDGGGELRSFKATDQCTAFDAAKPANDQPVDLQVVDFKLAGTFTKNQVNFVYQTWHRGDDEIVHVRGTLSGGDLTNVAFTNISKNQKAQ